MKKTTHSNLLGTDRTPGPEGENDEPKFGATVKNGKIELYRVIPEKIVKSLRKTTYSSRPVPRGMMPPELDEYIGLLRLADKLYRHAERCAHVRHGKARVPRTTMRVFGSYQARTLHGDAERAYERALEQLEQAMDNAQSAILPWLDRFVIFGRCCNLNPSPDPEGVPRVITVRSKYKRKV